MCIPSKTPLKRFGLTDETEHDDADAPWICQDRMWPSGWVIMTWALADDAGGTWRIESDPKAPSAPNVVVEAVPYPSAGCFQMLLAEGLINDYPDLAIRLRATSPGSQGVGGAVFGVKDSRNFYAAVVDLATDTLEVIRVLDGMETVLGRASVKPGRRRGISYAFNATRSSARSSLRPSSITSWRCHSRTRH